MTPLSVARGFFKLLTRIMWRAQSYIEEHHRAAVEAAAFPPGTHVVVDCNCGDEFCKGVLTVLRYDYDSDQYRLCNGAVHDDSYFKRADYLPSKMVRRA